MCVLCPSVCVCCIRLCVLCPSVCVCVARFAVYAAATYSIKIIIAHFLQYLCAVNIDFTGTTTGVVQMNWLGMPKILPQYLQCKQ